MHNGSMEKLQLINRTGPGHSPRALFTNREGMADPIADKLRNDTLKTIRLRKSGHVILAYLNTPKGFVKYWATPENKKIIWKVAQKEAARSGQDIRAVMSGIISNRCSVDNDGVVTPSQDLGKE